MLPSRAQNWPHPAALTSPLLELSAFRLYANKGSGWREGEAETCFVIKCAQHLSCCCLLMFRSNTSKMLWTVLDLPSNAGCEYCQQRVILFFFTKHRHFILKFRSPTTDESEGQSAPIMEQFTVESKMLNPASRWTVAGCDSESEKELKDIWWGWRIVEREADEWGRHDQDTCYCVWKETGGEGHLYSVSVGQQELRAPCPQHLKALSTGVQSAT